MATILKKVTGREIIVRVQPRTFLRNYHSFYGNFSLASLALRSRSSTCRSGLVARRIVVIGLSLITYHLSLPSPAYAFNIGDVFGFGQFISLGQVFGQLVPAGFSVAAALVIIYFLWGAFNWLKSGGNKEEVANARQMITHAIIGFIILIFAFLILQFLLSSLFKITGFQLFKS